ncbi:MAG TPA: hypothetical protein VGQ22_17730 [Steroidobacteraceae bacterium]|jgi:hypothetical protein|nr:hypothetical protein [Steroidobacteraceae bacterium]
MHRAIAAWLTEHPWRPIVAIAFCGALAQMLLPFTLLACAIPVLTVLRFDAKLGLAAAAVGAGVQCGIVFSLAPTVMAGTYPGILLAFFSPLALAVLLKRTGSLNLCFQVAVLAVAVLLAVVDVALTDPIGAWKGPLTQLVDAMQAPELKQADRDAIVAAFAPPMWGALGAIALAMVFGVLLLGRWWDSLLGPEAGAFGAEYQRLRLGVALGVAVTVLFVLAMITDFVLISWLTSVALIALTFQGLAAAHRSRAGGRFKLGWLAAIYVLLVVPVSNIVTMFVLASWGFIDNWLRPSRPASL